MLEVHLACGLARGKARGGTIAAARELDGRLPLDLGQHPCYEARA
jgi:hypothetical protein